MLRRTLVALAAMVALGCLPITTNAFAAGDIEGHGGHFAGGHRHFGGYGYAGYDYGYPGYPDYGYGSGYPGYDYGYGSTSA
jgi:hypothetical protein